MIVWAAIAEICYETRELIGIAHSRANAVKMCHDNPHHECGIEYDHQWVQRWLLGSTTRKGELETVK